MGRILVIAIAIAFSQSGVAGDIDRGAVDFTVPQDIKWVKAPGGIGPATSAPAEKK